MPVDILFETTKRAAGNRWPVCGPHSMRPCPHGCPLIRPADAGLPDDDELDFIERVTAKARPERRVGGNLGGD